jgi:hypothetical protein
MANPYHHAVSSARQWGGLPEDYLAIHQWFDESKAHLADFRHRALRHHSDGILLAERVFGATLELAGGAQIPVRAIGEQHVREDLGRIPSATEWLREITPQPWMNRARKLSGELEADAQAAALMGEHFVHATDAMLAPGTIIEPASTRGHRSRWANCPRYSPDSVYVYESDVDPIYFEQHGARVYAVAPHGPLSPDPERDPQRWPTGDGDPAANSWCCQSALVLTALA